MRRWILIIVVFALLLLAAGAVAVQVIFATDIPRRLVIDALEDQTGLRFAASSLESGWAGNTVLRDLTVALPLEADPFLRVSALRLTHTDLIRLVVFRDPILNAADVQQPEVWLRQNAQGQWNVLEAAQIVEQRLAAREAQDGEMHALPDLQVLDASIYIADRNQRHVTYGPITLHGESVDSLSWQFVVSMSGDELARGRLAPRAAWSHEINFNFQNAQQLVAPWLDDEPPVLQAAGNWSGQVTAAALQGTLDLSQLRVDRLTIAGETSVSVEGGAIVLHPQKLALSSIASNDRPMPVAEVRGGTIAADMASETLVVEQLLVHAQHVNAQINAGWEPLNQAAWAEVNWSGDLTAMQTQHAGSMALRVELPRVGEQIMTASIQSAGATPELRWESQWEIVGRGASWRRFNGTVSSPKLMVYTSDDAVDFSGVGARFAASWPRVNLTHLDLPGATTRGGGQADLAAGTWSADIRADQWRVPGLVLAGLNREQADSLVVDVHVQAAGNTDRVNLDSLQVSSSGATGVPAFGLTAGGVYVLSESQPLQARAAVRTLLDQDEIHAAIHADVAVTGIVHPLQLSLDGQVHATELSWEGRALHDLALPLRATLQSNQATFETGEFTLFDGIWTVQGAYDMPSRFAEAMLGGRGGSIERVMHFVDAPVDLAGRFNANVQIELPQLNVDGLYMQGVWSLAELAGPGLDAVDGRGRIDYFDHRVRLEEIHLAQEHGTLTGRAELDLRRSHQLHAQLDVAEWSVSLREYAAEAVLDGSATLDVDLLALQAEDGSAVNLQLDLMLDDQPMGIAQFHATLAGRTASIQQLLWTGLGGGAEGSGELHLVADAWHASTFDLNWWDIDLTRVPLRIQLEHELVGTTTGTLHVARSNDPRAPEPMQVDLTYALTVASYGPFSLGHGFVTGFFGPGRLLIQRSRFELADGTVELWGRISEHELQPFAHVHLQLNDLDLQQFADLVGYNEYPMPGRIHGEGAVGGYLHEPHRLFGQSLLRLTESDIASAPGIAQLYSAANIDFGRPEPSGSGEILVRLENDAIDIARLTYFNRGMDVVARARVLDIWAAGDSPIIGLAAGTVRPLRDTQLPLLGNNLDRLLRAIQADAISVRINGTVSDPRTTVVPLSEVSGALGRILRGRVE